MLYILLLVGALAGTTSLTPATSDRHYSDYPDHRVNCGKGTISHMVCCLHSDEKPVPLKCGELAFACLPLGLCHRVFCHKESLAASCCCGSKPASCWSEARFEPFKSEPDQSEYCCYRAIKCMCEKPRDAIRFIDGVEMCDFPCACSAVVVRCLCTMLCCSCYCGCRDEDAICNEDTCFKIIADGPIAPCTAACCAACIPCIVCQEARHMCSTTMAEARHAPPHQVME